METALNGIIAVVALVFVGAVIVGVVDTIRLGLDPDHRSVFEFEQARRALDPKDDE